METINLCGRPNSCCPELTINDEKTRFSITDDYGNIIVLNEKEMETLVKAYCLRMDAECCK